VRLPDKLGHTLPVEGIEQVGDGSTDQALGCIAEHALGRGTLVLDGPVAIYDRDQIGRMLHERSKACLRPTLV